jgi:hypothetical protein
MLKKIKINTKIIFILSILTILILILIYLISNFYEKFDLASEKKDWDDQGCWNDRGANDNNSGRAIRMPLLNNLVYIPNRTEEECFKLANAAGADVMGLQYPVPDPNRTQCFFSKFNNDNNFDSYMKYGKASTCAPLGAAGINRVWTKKTPLIPLTTVPDIPVKYLEMGGEFIGDNIRKIPVQVVKSLGNENSGRRVYLSKDGNYIKMVTNDNKEARYYTKPGSPEGSINTTFADLEGTLGPNKSIISIEQWNSYKQVNGKYLIFRKRILFIPPIDPRTPITDLEMGGPYIGNEQNRISVQAVKTLENTNGLKIYLSKDGNYIKMVTNDNKESRYYSKPGTNNTTIADLEAYLGNDDKSIILNSQWNKFVNDVFINTNRGYLVFLKPGVYSGCPPNYSGPDSTGMCRGGYLPGCDIDCEKGKCEYGANGTWVRVPNDDYMKSPYLCKIPFLQNKKESWEDQGCWNDKSLKDDNKTIDVNLRAIRMPGVLIPNQTEEECFDKAIEAGADIIGLQYPEPDPNKTQCFFSKFNDNNKFNDYMKYGKAATCADLGGAYINRVWKKNPNNWIDPDTPNEQLEIGGSFINKNDPNKRITIQAVKNLEVPNGPKIYIVKYGINIIMVTNDNRQSRNYAKQGFNGPVDTTIEDLNKELPNKSIIPLIKWNLYNNNDGNSLVFLKPTPIAPNTSIDKLHMGGVSIGNNRFSKRIPVQAVKTLENTNGLKIYLIKDGNFIKMVTNDNKQSRYYTKQGSNNTTIADLEADLPGSNKSIIPLSKWNSNSYVNNNGDYLVFLKEQAAPAATTRPAIRTRPPGPTEIPEPTRTPEPTTLPIILKTLILDDSNNRTTTTTNSEELLPYDCNIDKFCRTNLIFRSDRI